MFLVKKITLYFISFVFLAHSGTYVQSAGEIETFLENPYRELKVAPWATMSDIRKQYKEMVKKYHPDKANKGNRKSNQEKFIQIQRAYEAIKAARKIENDDEESDSNDNAFNNYLSESIQSILGIVLFMGGVYGLLWAVYKFYDATWRLILNMLIVFFVVDRFLPHYFNTRDTQYCASFVLGLVWHFKRKFFRFVFGILGFGNKKPEDNKDNSNEKKNN